MKYRLLELLICPNCGNKLYLKPDTIEKDRAEIKFPDNGLRCELYCGLLDKPVPLNTKDENPNCGQCYKNEIISGKLYCKKGHEYNIEDGVPVLLTEDLSGQDAKTAETFGYEWLRYRVDLGEEEKSIFLSETQSDPEDFEGKLVLDAGCGMGRFTSIAASLGAEVVGIDLSSAVKTVFKKTSQYPLLHIIRGDLLNPPFRKESFDLIYSLGVLHHTPDTKAAFDSIVPSIKNGGAIAFWLYGRASEFEFFKTNPLEPTRASFFEKHPFLLRPYWIALKTREFFSDALRKITTRMPVPILYKLCLVMVPFGAVPLLKFFTFSVHPNWKVRHLENFDWLSPPYQYKHTKEEARAWIEEQGLVEDKMLDHGLVPKIGFKAKKNK